IRDLDPLATDPEVVRHIRAKVKACYRYTRKNRIDRENAYSICVRAHHKRKEERRIAA
ncbi:unnamed protein product, partial [marine sediment metagenome]